MWHQTEIYGLYWFQAVQKSTDQRGVTCAAAADLLLQRKNDWFGSCVNSNWGLHSIGQLLRKIWTKVVQSQFMRLVLFGSWHYKNQFNLNTCLWRLATIFGRSCATLNRKVPLQCKQHNFKFEVDSVRKFWKFPNITENLREIKSNEVVMGWFFY